MCRTMLSPTCLNTIASPVATLVWSLTTRLSIVMAESCKRSPSGVPTGKFHRTEVRWPRNQLNSRPPPVYLYRHAAFASCQAPSPSCAGVASCWRHNLSLTARSTASCSTGRTVRRKLRCRAVSLSGNRVGPKKPPPPTIPAQTLTKLNSYKRSRTTCVLHPEVTVGHTLAQKTRCFTEHRMLC
jgi:hypothetical protein